MAADRLIGTGFVVLGMAMIWSMSQLTFPNLGPGDPGPVILPMGLGIVIAVLGAILALRRPAATVASDGPDGNLETATIVPAEPPILRVVHLVNLVAYAALFERLGFSVSTFLFLAVAIFLLGQRSARGAAIAIGWSLLVTFIVGTGLSTLVGVPLPGVIFG
ncbi:tripartite tricarboxylate transporter TctB family protein [Arsenicitalea aurantiaca]|nr:tripartite tricarboxylate transporter TctB family protein [Arsenicitalea aurantiaca]